MLAFPLQGLPATAIIGSVGVGVGCLGIGGGEFGCVQIAPNPNGGGGGGGAVVGCEVTVQASSWAVSLLVEKESANRF